MDWLNAFRLYNSSLDQNCFAIPQNWQSIPIPRRIYAGISSDSNPAANFFERGHVYSWYPQKPADS